MGPGASGLLGDLQATCASTAAKGCRLPTSQKVLSPQKQ